MAIVLQLRTDTAANWASNNPVLALGELGLVSDTKAYKIGDGSTAWNSLSYRELSGLFDSIVMDAGAPDPSTPSGDDIAVYGTKIADRAFVKWIGSSGLDTVPQPALFNNTIVMLSPNTTTTFNTIGTAAPTSVGTVSTPTLVAGNGLYQGMRRTLIKSAASAMSLASSRINTPITYMGDSSNVGGFFFSARFGIDTAVSDSNFCIGMSATTGALTSDEPSTFKNSIWCGWDSTDSNLMVMSIDNSTIAEKVDLGANFPKNSEATAVYDFTLFCPPGSSEVGYRVKRLDQNYIADGILSTHTPLSTSLLTYNSKMYNGATAAAVGYAISKVYIEVDK